ncbi:MAG: hypothetical protein ABJF04_09055 [Reichenbachiella sp.]|uniref:hypothetical protein n=2 Tax=Reichenbachiella sp. TaxID=2184521 RepID=UPI0032672FEB
MENKLSMYKSCFKTFPLLFVLLSFNEYSLLAQSCDNDSGIIDLLFSIVDDINLEEEGQEGPSEPMIRTEDTEFKYGVSFMFPKREIDFRSIGLDLAIYQRISGSENTYIGAGFSVHNYGTNTYDTLLNDYDRIETNHTVYGANFLAKYKVADFKFIQAYIGMHAGLLFFATKSHAIDDLDPCEGGEESRKLHGHTTISGNVGATLGLQIPLKSYFDKISIDIGYQIPGLTTYVRNDDVDISPHRIDYNYSIDNLNMLTFQIGLSHYF